MIMWYDPDDSGSDHGLSIDDLSIAWSASSATPLGLSATPDNFVENAGAAASTGEVTIPAILGADLEVTLESNDTSEATVPPTVTITAGNTSATFPIDAVDDFLADGSQSVTITASASGYVSAMTGITVNDDTDAAIAVSVVPGSFLENAGTSVATGTVTLAANTAVDLTVDLNSGDISEATVPASVLITSGTNSATFPVDAVDDSEPDGDKNVTIFANATGYTSGNTVIVVQDDGDTAPAPTLSPGAIAFTGFNADGGDDLAFVALVEIAEGEEIHFTDNEWDGGALGSGGALTSGEGYITWTAPVGGVAQGNVVTLNSLSNSGRTASVGTISAIGSFNLGSGGDSVYAYQGSYLAPTGFIAVVATTTGDPVGGTGLNAEHVVYLPTNVDFAAYSGSRSNQPTYPGYLTSIGDTVNNWVTDDGSGDQSIDGNAPDLPFDTTAFTLGTGGSGYATWIDGFYSGEVDPLIIGFGADPDKDGITNGVEAILGLSPAASNGGIFTDIDLTGSEFTFVIPMASSPPSGVTPSYEWSTDLVNWQGDGDSFGGVTVTFDTPLLWDDQVTPNLFQIKATITAGTPTKIFVRVLANNP